MNTNRYFFRIRYNYMGTRRICEVFFFTLLMSIASCSAGFRQFTLKDSFLPNQAYKELRTFDWFQCLQVCANEEGCISYSYDNRKIDGANCELHACGFKTECEAQNTVVVSQDSIFHQLGAVQEQGFSKTSVCQKAVDYSPTEAVEDVKVEMRGGDLCDEAAPMRSSPGSANVFKITVCGKRKKTLDHCADLGTKIMEITRLEYVRCNCSCDSSSCSVVGNLCPSSVVYKKVQQKCQGRKKCRIRLTNDCDDDIMRSLGISYRCAYPLTADNP